MRLCLSSVSLLPALVLLASLAPNCSAQTPAASDEHAPPKTWIDLTGLRSPFETDPW